MTSRSPRSFLNSPTRTRSIACRTSSVEPSEDSTSDNLGLYFGSRLDWELTKDIDFSFESDSFVSADDLSDATHSLITTLSFEVVSDFDIDFSLLVDRKENPEADGDGVLPDKDDIRFIIGLGWEF